MLLVIILASNKSYKDLIKPALEKITQQFSLKQIKALFYIPDNAAEFYCQDISTERDQPKQNNLKQKATLWYCDNVLSENWFSFISEWLPKVQTNI
ncbi:hypothetical protein [Spiroplasma endosymbiont of Lariophagus distinguendus]|uniref:hypothetical protein n=1 Tax=Spiroplasma endosymbiont of Lariophagus distinguendus TaxID=2935082 RepID=UPI00207933E9|nr:hypothetical protein [Spiroplasma endosymbiont of Lariophagus distinguendus]